MRRYRKSRLKRVLAKRKPTAQRQLAAPGIDEADLDRIFQAFYTTKSIGLGMGLAIARSIVEAPGGRLGTQNNAEGGATFSFTLPVSEQGP